MQIIDKYFKLSTLPYINNIVNGVNSILFITDANREIVYLNDFTIKKFKIESKEEYLGVKIGNFFKCIHSTENTDGCGSSESCKVCGGNDVFTKSFFSKESFTSEYRVTTIKNKTHSSLDLQITANPLVIDDETFGLFSINDISDKKRKAALERTFFHDIMNTTGGIKAFVEFLKEASNIDESKEFIHHVDELTERLIDEINSQRILLSAENEEIALSYTAIDINKLINLEIEEFKLRSIANNKTIKKSINYSETLIADEVLLKRIISNMLKNALEAAEKNDTIAIGVKQIENNMLIWVNNPQYIERNIQLQIFQRSFSTKGGGRGLGTYGMKLLGEQYLKGKVYFESSEENGTTFFIELPLKPE
ncbi:MAG: HAMP domain-containing sensor histidine kinase [Bacteroidota bacterium]